MSEIKNTEPMEKLIHLTFHQLAVKYQVDVDKIAEIIKSYDEMMSRYLQAKVLIHLN